MWLKQRNSGLLRSLLEDSRGNTLAMTAAAAVPLLAMVGGGVDVSRAYMAKTQLQAACDAGVLAGRRAMNKSGEYSSAEKAKAQTMFDVNFSMGSVPADSVNFETTDNDDGEVWGTAQAILPTAVMYFFGKDEINLNVECMAELQLANVDAMFVLDTTGSMAGSRIEGLREAVKDFHRTLADAITGEETRVRYGFVPYSSTVNIGNLLDSGAVPTDYFVDQAYYQSREALFNTPVYIGTTQDIGSVNQTYPSPITSSQCTQWSRNNYPSSGTNPHTTGASPNPVTKTTYSKVSWTKTSGSVGTCIRKAASQQTTYEIEYTYTRWRYRKLPLDTSVFKTRQAVPFSSSNLNNVSVKNAGWYNQQEIAAMSGTQARNVKLSSSTWNGCLEERSTVSAATFKPIPAGAWDLEINLLPYDDDTRWRPMWTDLEFPRDTNPDGWETTTVKGKASAACPAPMMLFRDVNITAGTEPPSWMVDYLDGLIAQGNTYHDIGMIWGARLASQTGMFADNVNEGDLHSVSRHLIYMTDGKMEPTQTGYTIYGIERYDNRIAPAGTTNANVIKRHNERFLAACAKARSMGYTVWLIGFGTSLTAEMKECASDGRAYFAGDNEALSNTFRFIGAQIANLRLGA